MPPAGSRTLTLPPFEAFFAQPDAHTGRRLCVHTPPKTGALRGAILHVHAFAEEMNKSRRMTARAARALAAAGFAVLQIDLHGCGDSDGEFSQARWETWRADVRWAAGWLAQRYDAPLWLWGHRAGALLASVCVPAMDHGCNLLFWHPIVQGKTIVQQFVRMKAAADWASGDGKAAAAWVKTELAAGRVVDIAGYGLDPALVRELDAAVLMPAVPRKGGQAPRLVWLEVGGREGEPTLSPVAQMQLSKWRAAGWRVAAGAVSGPAFWQTVEIEDAPAMIDATVQALCESETAASAA